MKLDINIDEYKEYNKRVDASHRNGDGSIHISFISYYARTGPSGRTVPERGYRRGAASSYIFNALPYLLPYRAEGSEAPPLALVAPADSGRPFHHTGSDRCVDHRIFAG